MAGNTKITKYEIETSNYEQDHGLAGAFLLMRAR